MPVVDSVSRHSDHSSGGPLDLVWSSVSSLVLFNQDPVSLGELEYFNCQYIKPVNHDCVLGILFILILYFDCSLYRDGSYSQRIIRFIFSEN